MEQEATRHDGQDRGQSTEISKSLKSKAPQPGGILFIRGLAGDRTGVVQQLAALGGNGVPIALRTTLPPSLQRKPGQAYLSNDVEIRDSALGVQWLERAAQGAAATPPTGG